MALPWLAQAQCPADDVILSSQAQVDAFPAGCTNLSGRLIIQGDDITNLNKLKNLQSVGGDLAILGNSQLTSIAALTALTRVGGDVAIYNTELPSLDGLNNLQSVSGNVQLIGNLQLTGITALMALTRVGGDVQFTTNPVLPSLDGLNQLQSVGGSTRIINNAQLSSIAALTALTLVGRDVQISSNGVLTSLQGLNNLQPVRSLRIFDNSQLAVCALSSICRLIATLPPAEITFSGNAPGCGSVEQVQANCLAITTQPATGATACAGSSVTATVSASGSGITYQWYRGNQPVSGQTSATLTLTNVQPADGGTYVAVVSNTVSSLTSTAFTLTVTPLSPDYQPLVDLYISTNGPTWINKANWLTGCSPCGWQGVTCDGNGRVVVLNLATNGLRGPLPASLSQLTGLQTVDLSNNQLSGPIPASLSNLTNLTFLGLGRNQLTGTIPPDLSKLTSLTVLALDNNKLEGAIPTSLSALTNLQAIFLSNNQLSGSIPAYIGSLSKLDLLWLDNNQLSGMVPASLGNLAKLTSLLLNNNQLSGCFPASLSALCGRPNSFFNFSNNANLPGGGDFAAFCNSGAGSDAFRPLATANPNAVCVGNPVSLSVSAGTFYQWSGPAGFAATTQTPGFTPASAASSGVYSVTVGNGSPTCTATASVSLTVNALPSVSISPSSSTVCAGQTVTLSATPGLASYVWSTGQTTASISVTTTGTYAVTATNASRCSATASASVTVRPTPPAPAIATQSGQSGQLYPAGKASVTVPQYSGTVTLLISGCNGTINWQGPNGSSGTSTSIAVATPTTGTFVYRATCQQDGCPSAPVSATVVVQSAPLMVVAPLFDCVTGKLTLRTTGGNGQPIEYQIPSVTNGWQATNPVNVEAKDFRKSLKLRARQRASDNKGYDSAEMDYQLPTCPGARLGVSEEPVAPLSVMVLGNPVRSQELSVEVRGAEGQPLRLQLTDLSGRVVGERSLERAGAVELQSLPVGNQPAGLLLLRVSTPSQSQTVKVLKVE